MSNLIHLLQQVTIIRKKYDEIAKITGENFNIFSVLKMDSKEVRMHSAFIGELLNPKGTHGLKDVPLKLFVSLLNSKFKDPDAKDGEAKSNEDKFKIEKESAVTKVEKYIGNTNKDKTEGGRIDIIIEDKNKNAIIIENKINAPEQENQLIRYNNYNFEAPILFLTLNGDKPQSAGDLIENKDYFIISYTGDIIKWLELCQKEAVEFPMLREVIKQYIYLIKKLTNQTTNKKMEKDVAKVMGENVSSSFDIWKNMDKMKDKLYKDFFKQIEDYSKENNIYCDISNIEKNDDVYGVSLTPNNWKDKPYVIDIAFDSDEGDKMDYHGLFVGLNFIPHDLPNDKKEAIKELFKPQVENIYDLKSESYAIWKLVSKPNWGMTSEIWEDVAKGKDGEIYKEVISIIEEIIEIEKNISAKSN